MSEKKIVVPEGMLNAARKATAAKMRERIYAGDLDGVPELYVARIAVEAAVRWLSENPIVPECAVYDEMCDQFEGRDGMELTLDIIGEWQKRMFLALVPENIEDLLIDETSVHEQEQKGIIPREGYMRPDIYNERILEAYRRGKQSK